MTSSLPCGQTSLLLQMTERLALSDAHFRRISQLIYQRAGIVLADHKRDMDYNRLVRRLRSLGLTDFRHYLNLLESNQHRGEWQAFINSLTTNLTAFFREEHHFPLLADHARRRSGEYRVDRKSTRLNSSHVSTSYAVFCLQQKKQTHTRAS